MKLVEGANLLVDYPVSNTGLSTISARDNGIELVENDDTWTEFLSFLENVSDSLLTCTDVFVKQFRTFYLKFVHAKVLGN